MIDHRARSQMASAVRSYMDGEIAAFQLDEALGDTMDATEDETVKSIGQVLWLYYDDIQDHRIVASKEEWDYFNRLLLLLESDGEIEVVKSARRWHLRQAIAAICLAAFCALAVRTGFGGHLLFCAMPFGAVSMTLAWWASREQRKRYKADNAITPFPSVANLLSVRRRVPGFRKRRYPQAIAGRRIRGRSAEMVMWLGYGVMWLMFAPIPLLFQMLPYREYETTIRMPEQTDAADG